MSFLSLPFIIALILFDCIAMRHIKEGQKIYVSYPLILALRFLTLGKYDIVENHHKQKEQKPILINMNTDGSVDGSNQVPLLSENNATYLQIEAQPASAYPAITPQQAQPQQVVMVATQQPSHQPSQTIEPYQVQQINTNSDLDSENYLYTGKVGNLTICHWLACLFCNCCGCALIGFILNQLVVAAKKAGYHKLAYFISEKAKCWMITACICTLIPWIIFCILFAGGFMSTVWITDQIHDAMDGNN